MVREAPIRAADGTLDHGALEALLGERTRVVAFTLASNALGAITDAGRIAAAATRVGALAWADGVHLAPHRRLRRAELGIHVLLCSPYKFFGPHLGVAAIERGLAESLPADRVRPAAEWPPGHRFETGTQSHEAIAGTAAAIEYLRSLGDGGLDAAFERIRDARGGALPAISRGRRGDAGLDLYGIADPERTGERTPTFCFNLGESSRAGSRPSSADRDIYVWDGDYYALAPMRALGLSERGAVRAGFLHYTTDDEVDRLLSALAELA